MADAATKSSTSDSWCTPKWLAEMLGPFDLDPCSNAASHIASAVRFAPDGAKHDPEKGDAYAADGLKASWVGSVFCNPPYSNPLPWAQKLRDHRGPWCALLKLDPSTRWWAALMAASPTVAPFRKRIKFEGDRAMTANFPSVLVFSRWYPPVALRPHLWLQTWAVAA